MTSAEFTQWLAYQSVEPYGYPMERWDSGLIVSQIVNAIYATIPIPKGKRRPKPLQPKDFMPQAKERGPELTPKQKAHIRKKHGKRRNSNS